MEKFKFDAHNPEYKQVKDLPIEVQDRYVDLSEGGFTIKDLVNSEDRREERLTDNQERVDSLNKRILSLEERKVFEQELKDAIETYKTLSPWRQKLFSLAWYFKNGTGRKPSDHREDRWSKFFDQEINFLNSELEQKKADFDLLKKSGEHYSNPQHFYSSSYSYSKFLDATSQKSKFLSRNIVESTGEYDAVVDNFREDKINQARFEAFEDQRLKLSEMGHSGQLSMIGEEGDTEKEKSESGEEFEIYPKKITITGLLDGIEVRLALTERIKVPVVDGKINIEHRSSELIYEGGSLGEIDLTPEETEEIYSAYKDTAIDLEELDLETYINTPDENEELQNIFFDRVNSKKEKAPEIKTPEDMTQEKNKEAMQHRKAKIYYFLPRTKTVDRG